MTATQVEQPRTPYEAARATLSALDRYLYGYAMGLARGAHANDANPNVSAWARARYREVAVEHLASMLTTAGQPVDPYIAAWKVVAK